MGWVGGRPAAGEAATLLYNRDASELRHKKDLVVHIGVNGWDGDTTEVAMAKDDRGAAAAEALGEGDWYAAKVGVPKRATIVDFVISDTNKQARVLPRPLCSMAAGPRYWGGGVVDHVVVGVPTGVQLIVPLRPA